MKNDFIPAAPGGGPCVAAWAPVIWGGFAASALSIVLVVLGAGLGLAITPQPEENLGALALGGVIWLIVVQWLAAGLGGYLAGRLRAPWPGIHTDEAYFRDTAHGFLAWSVATVFAAVSFASAAPAVSAGLHLPQRGAHAHSLPGSGAIDALLRPAHPGVPPLDEDVRREAVRILAAKDPSAPDKAYLAQVVAARADIPASEAEARIDTTVTRMNEQADAARKNAGQLSIFLSLSMLIGAFVAAAAGALGGVHRDRFVPRV